MKEANMLTKLHPPRLSVLKKMKVGDTVIFKHTEPKQASSSMAKVPDFSFSQQTSLIVSATTLEATKVVLVHRVE